MPRSPSFLRTENTAFHNYPELCILARLTAAPKAGAPKSRQNWIFPAISGASIAPTRASLMTQLLQCFSGALIGPIVKAHHYMESNEQIERSS
jgi:hypothetical protein